MNVSIVHWTKLSDKYPEPDTPVLIYYKDWWGNKHIMQAKYMPLQNVWQDVVASNMFIDTKNGTITHWAPYPNGPEEE